MGGRRVLPVVGVVAALLAALATSTPGTSPARVAGTVGASGLPSAVAPGPGAAAAGPQLHDPLGRDRDAVAALLVELARAFRTGDPAALGPLLHDPTTPFGQRWLERAASLAELEFATYTLALDGSLPDLTTAALADDGALLVNVVEDHALAGTGALGPARHHLYLTLRQRDGRWTVAGDDGARTLGLRSAKHLWDHGPVTVTARDDVVVLHHPGQPGVARLLDEAVAARDLAAARWPLDWPGIVVLHLPADLDELGAVLRVSYDLTGFLAFATGTTVGTLGETRVTGSRVLLDTERFLTRGPATRRDVLVHEFVHAASRPSTGPSVPAWFEEGVAQALGEQGSRTGTDELARLRPADRVLPRDVDFTGGGTGSVDGSYQLAWSFVDRLVRDHGADVVGAFYLAAGADAVGAPGTDAARLDAAASAVLGATLAELEERWRTGP